MIGRSLCRSIALLSLILIVKALPTHSTTFYFTNQSLIDKYQDNIATTVIQEEANLQALDCNSCDGRIYWANSTTIRRSFPNGSSPIENVISTGLTELKGVAVDWRSNLVYYTDQRTDGGRLEVATCDGASRRVLFEGGDSFDIGAVAVDSSHGYIFYADRFCCIYRAHSDGSNRTLIINAHVNREIRTIALDQEQNRLYWIEGNLTFTVIGSSNLNGGNRHFFPQSILGDSEPAGLSVSDGTLFWTHKRKDNENGAIYSYDPSQDVEGVIVYNKESLDPLDISVVVSEELRQNATGGCSDNNGGCSNFCFTLPGLGGTLTISNQYKCGCPTGFAFVDGNQTCVESPNQFLLIAQGNIVNLLSIDIPSEEIPLPLPFIATGTVEHVSYYHSDEYVYWSQRSPPAIMRCKLDGTGMETIVNTSLAKPEGLVVDSSGRTLYWADAALDLIEVLDIVTKSRRVLIDTGLDHPRDLAIDEKSHYLYWTDTGRNPKLERAFLNGTERKILVSTDNFSIRKPSFLAIHPQNGDYYWSEGEQLGDKYNIYIKAKTNPVRALTSPASGLAFFGNDLYWTDRENGVVEKVDVTASIGNVPDENIVASGLNGVRSLLSVNLTLATPDNGCHLDNGGCSDICVTGGTCLCRDHAHLEGDECVPDVLGEFLLSNSTHVLAFYDFVLNNEEEIFGHITFAMPITAAVFDVDVKMREIFWVDTQDGHIYKRPINDESHVPEPILTCCYDNITDVAVDWWGRNLYWVDSALGVIGVVKLDGKSNQILLDGLDNPSHLEIDLYSSQLFFVLGGTKVVSVSLTGKSTISTIWSNSTSGPVKDFTMDIKERFLFWTYDNCIYEYRIGLSPPPHSIFCAEDSSSFSLISYFDQYLFVLYDIPDSEDDEICQVDEHVANDGCRFYEELFRIEENLNIRNLLDFKHFHYTIQPDTHWCTRSNAECSDDALCLVDDIHNFECRCEPTEYLRANFDNDLEVCGYNCITPDTFLLLSTDSSIQYLPLVFNITNFDPTCEDPPLSAHTLPLGPMREVKAVTYDPLNQKVFWIDQSPGSIKSAGFNGTGYETLKTDVFIRPNSFIYDYKGGNLLWTDSVLSRIEYLSFDGSGAGILHENVQYYNYNVTRPFSAAFDPQERVLYWSDTVLRTLNSISLKQDSSLESSRVHIGSDDISRKVLIQSMALEPKNRRLFFTDAISSKIMVYHLDYRTTEDLPVTVDVSHISALAATVIKRDTLVLFWFDTSDHCLYSYNVTSTYYGKYYCVEEGVSVTSILAHNNDGETFTDTSCLSERECSHICLLDESLASQYSCGCPVHRTLINSTTCGAVACDGVLRMCPDQSDCIPYTAFCDGIEHCLDGSDERDCPCAPDQEFYCYLHNASTMCVPSNRRCNGVPDCLRGEDEVNCVVCDQMCTLLGDSYPSCIVEGLICDGQADCKDRQDEEHCNTASVTPTMSSVPTSIDSNDMAVRLSVVIAIVICVFVLVVFCVGMLVGVTLHYYCNHRGKVVNLTDNTAGATRNGVYNMTNIPPNISPQPPGIQSLTTSELSLNTMETRSTHVDKISDSRLIKRLSTLSTDPSNPPNSPITERSMAFPIDTDSIITTPNNDETISVVTRPVPRVPNPSVNYDADAISENISSVSQRRFPGAIPHNRILPPLYQETMYNHEDHGHLQYMMEDPVMYDERYHTYPPTYDNISESTVSMVTYEGYTTSSYMSNSHSMFKGERGGDVYHRDNKTLEEEETMGDYYDGCPPPPSPVTEYSVHGGD